MMNVYPDHRAFPRTAISLVVQFERTASAPGPDLSSRRQGMGYDISAQGAGFLTDCPLHQGEILRLLLPLEASHTPVPVVSEVRWSRAVREGFRVGLQFLV